LPGMFLSKGWQMNLEARNFTETILSAGNSGSDVKEKSLTIALAGNANVGKSAIFNQLTGLVQETGNWAGKTVGIREGSLLHHQRQIKIVDLPGIYSFSTYSPEEQVTREYILTRYPDVVINVVDATSLERNLYFTLQLREMGVPVIIALNFADIAKKKHIHIDHELMGKILGYPVFSTLAIKGIGIHELVDAALSLIGRKQDLPDFEDLKYGPEVESRIAKITDAFSGIILKYPPRWLAIKLLEGDAGIREELEKDNSEPVRLSQKLASEISAIHGEDSSAVIISERYALAARIAREINIGTEPAVKSTARLENISLHPFVGYLLFFAVMVAILVFISFFGGWLTGIITGLFERLNPQAPGVIAEIFWSGGVVGFYAALSVALGFILPFFLILGFLGESGYLPRIAFLMDRPFHLIGLHGQASLPIIMALGCNVPACLGCRIMDNKRDRLIATFLTTIVPCSARTSVVLGLVGAFVGWQWAVGLLAFQFILIFCIGLILTRLSPSTSPGIIMEIPEYRMPSLKVIWRQAWNRFKEFLTLGVPMIVAGSLVIESLQVFNILRYITSALTPLTVTWLGLPAFTGVLLIFGILRKEANLALLIAFAGGASIISIISPLQMVVFSIVIMLYIPCISTIAVLWRETGLKMTILMVLAEIILALLLGGIAYRVLGLVLPS
jgi:ferrous iron transport protein B